MPNPTNLSEYYASQGQSLPSVQVRSGVASQAGIQNYTGTAQQNTQLLSYLQSQGNQAQGTQGIQQNGAVSIPANVATGNIEPIALPNQPISTATADVYSSASSYLSSLPKTGVAGLDSTLEAMQNRPGQLATQYGISAKQSKATETQRKLDALNEEYRVLKERITTNPALGAEVVNARLNEVERKRAFTAGTLAIEAAAANQDYQGALSLMNQQAQLELEPLKMRYEFFKDMYDRTQDQAFARQMRDEEREYEAEKARLEQENQLKYSALGTMSPEKAEAFAKDKTAQEAMLNQGVVNLLNQYKTMVSSFGRTPTKKQEKQANSFVLDILAPKLSVALGQGGMTTDEIKNKIDSLGVKQKWKRESVTLNNIETINSGVKTLLGNNLQFLELNYPGVSNLPLFNFEQQDTVVDDYLNSALSNDNVYSSYLDSLLIQPTQ